MKNKPPVNSYGTVAQSRLRFAETFQFSILVACVVGAAVSANANQTWHVNAATGADANDGLTVATAFATIQKAIDSAAWGDRILVGDGVYGAILATNQLLTIESVNGPEFTIIDGQGETRAAYLGTGGSGQIITNCLVRGFTIRNGVASWGGGGICCGTAENCVVSNNYGSCGGGSWGGHRVACIFTGNYSDQYGGATAYGTMSRCVISNNIANLGGGSYYTTVNNSIFVANLATGGGGAGYYGDFDHCTFYSNHAESGGALYRGTAVNCIFFANTSDYDDSGSDTYRTDVAYSLVCGMVANSGAGMGIIAGNPLFLDAENGDFRLQPSSPCINSGDPMVSFGGSDFDDSPRVRDGRTDMGAFEANLPGISGVFAVTPKGGLLMPLGNAIIHDGESAAYRVVSPRSFLGFYTNGVFASSSSPLILATQENDIVLEARFDISSPITIYADASQSDGVDGRTPTTAFASLQNAIDVAVAGDTILAGPGTYKPITTANRAIEIRSSDGAETTIIDGGGTNRCAKLGDSPSETSTLLVGFTLQNGGPVSGSGAGSRYGTLEHCILKDNHANGLNAEGGGAYGGILRYCTIESNSATNGNYGIAGGGASRATLEFCTLSGNAARGGGGAALCTLRDCVIESNTSAWDGGGLLNCTASRCVIRQNHAGYDGGGIESGDIDNCLIVENSAAKTGGGVGGGYWWDVANLVNCTIAGNTAGIAGGGVCAEVTDDCHAFPGGPKTICYGVSLNNCVVWNNSLANGALDNAATTDSNANAKEIAGSGILASHTCSFPLLDGSGNVEDNPRFASPDSDDFHLMEVSPCVDSGSLEISTSEIRPYSENPGARSYVCEVRLDVVDGNAIDLEGNPRRLFDAIDMGCYERTTPVPRERTFAEIWGAWSSESTPDLAMPQSVDSWNSLAQSLWNARDAYVRAGTATEVVPSTNQIVLSVGAVAVPDSLFVDLPAAVTQEFKCGATVHHLHLREDADTGCLIVVGDETKTSLATLPAYLADEWVRAVYGNPPAWLSDAEKTEWFAARARNRIEWFATLVSESEWTTYVEGRSQRIAEAEEANEGEPVFAMDGIIPATQTQAVHHVSVLSSSAGTVRLFGTGDLSTPDWEYRSLSIQPRGPAAAGAVADADAQFFFATRGNADSDSDGIPDAVETYVLGSNPHKSDTSGDGLSDWEKVYRYDLDPVVRDTAGDGVSDAEKIAAGTDPRIALSPAQTAAASRSIRYTYDDDDRLTGTWFGLGGASTTTDLTPAGNPEDIRDRNAAQ